MTIPKEIQGQKYISLTTFRKNGQAVKTPVWFAEQDGMLYVKTRNDSGKYKRIRNNPRVKIAPCDMRGRVLGEWVEARVAILTGEEAARGMRLLNKKYFPWKQMLDFFAMFRRRERTVFAIRPA